MATNVFNNSQKSSITTVQTVYSAPVGQASIVLECDIANTSASTASVQVKVLDNSETTEAYLVKDAQILSGSSMKVVSGQKIVLAAEDSITVTSDETVDCVVSVLEDIN